MNHEPAPPDPDRGTRAADGPRSWPDDARRSDDAPEGTPWYGVIAWPDEREWPDDATPPPPPPEDLYEGGSDVRPIPQAWELDRTAPSDLGFLLEGTDLDDLDDYTLLETVAAWQRVASWASAHAADAAGALAERPAMNPDWPAVAGKVARPCIAAEEVAMRLSWSRQMGERLVRQGTAFRGALGWTGDALVSGTIDTVKAAVLVDALADEPLELALIVQERVLPDAPGLTPTKLRRRVEREVLMADPSGTRARNDAALAKRRVERYRPLPGGMASIRAVLPAADAARIDNGLDLIARTAQSAGDTRTLDQLRADFFRDLSLGLVRPCAPANSTNADDDARTGTGTSAGTGTGTGTESNSPVNGSAEITAATGNGTAGADGDTPAASSTPAVTSDFPIDLTGVPQRAVIHVTVPLSTLLGTSDEPGDLAGYGPIHADTARALAEGGDWARIVTDPLTGAVLDVGRTRYRPTKAIADHVRHRDRTCVQPSCSRPAHACEIDHTIGWDDGGHTADHNLDPLCKRDHQLKTHGGLELEQLSPGCFRLRTPAGETYDITPGQDGVARRHPPRSPWDDPPPF